MAEGAERDWKRAKKDSTLKHWLGWLLLAALGWVPIQQGFAACDPWVARVISAQGQVEVTQLGKAQWRRVARQQTFCSGDQVRVEARSRATIQFHDQTNLTLDAGTTITFSKIEPDKPSLIELIKGAIYFFSRVPHRLTIETPFISAGMEGTEFVLRVDSNEAAIWVFEGRVSFSNAAGSLTLTSGEAAVAQPGKGPMRRTVVRPRDAVQWALYYPPIIDNRTNPTDTPGVRDALAHYRRDDLPAAFASLDAVPAASRDARYFTLRAGLLLNIGRVDEVRADIDQAMKLDPNNGTAYALQSVIAVAQNEDEQALYLARKAADLDSRSPVPQVALSYAYQAKSDIDKARESTQKAVELAPDDALAYARLSELELSRGDLNRSMEAAEKAASLDPTLARTQSVLGFAYLTRIDIDKAKETFNKAIQLDPAAPLPRLGMGLAKIRDGDLKEGTKEIELAASLDPDNAIVRSYLGKAYFEEKRGGQASTEFELAKDLDPNDPTPWFYDAIHKQTTNRPVEALHDLQKAIELNDNRAVYRSSLLLDQDEAARSATLGRIYNDLGFEERALVEGWYSSTTDPANYSAHRLLADTYASRSRSEIARVSELLQSQLLQPVNITPVQPQLAETDLLAFEGTGPADPSFNEFNSLFTRNRLTLQASGIVGNNDTLGDEVTQSGIWGKFSYSLGQFHFENDGFRENNGVEQDLYNVFVQAAITPKLNVQAEYRRREREQGDLQLNFDPDDFLRDRRQIIEQDTVRLGARFAPFPHSDLIVSGIYTNRTEEPENDRFPVDFATKGYQVEAQYLFRQDWLNVTIGGGHNDLDDEISIDFLGFQLEAEFDNEHSNAYAYTNLSWPSAMTWTLGLTYDSIKTTVPPADLSKVNPKVGLQWNLTDWVRLRLAYFRTVKRALAVNQTIEPTHVAGFNQFFDDANGTETERYGIGLDAVLTDELYTGLEYSRRDLESPVFSNSGGRVTFNRREELARGYLDWTPHDHWAVSAEAEFEEFKRPSADLSVVQGGEPTKVETVSVPLAVRYFHPSGFFAGLGGTFVHQHINLAPQSTFTRDSDEFFLVDGFIGYRLPKRRGIISLQARNLFDEEFLFQDLTIQTATEESPLIRDPAQGFFIPERTLFLRATFAFN